MTDCCTMVLLIKIKKNNNTNVQITRLTILISKEKNKKKFIKELHLQLTFQTKHTHNINEQSLTKGIHKWLTTICITINVYVSRLRSYILFFFKDCVLMCLRIKMHMKMTTSVKFLGLGKTVNFQ